MSWEQDPELAPLIRRMLSARGEEQVLAAQAAALAWIDTHPGDRRVLTVQSAGESLWMKAEAYRGADVIPFPGVEQPGDRPEPE